MKINIVSVASLAALLLAPVISGHAFTSPGEAPPSLAELKKLHDLEEAFSIIESVPDDVCEKGEEAAHKWVQEHYRPKNELEKRGFRDIVECAWELVTFAPIVRIRRLIKKLGGGRRVASLLRQAIKYPKKRRGALKELIDLILSIRKLKKECWDDLR